MEIGKTDIYQNKPLGLFPFRNNLSYFAVDLDRVCRERPEILRSLLLELMAMFQQGKLKPLAHNIFPIEDAANAFRYMARRKNIGKVVLSFTSVESRNRSDRSAAPRADATYLITGGSGGLGLAVARWLVEKGARNLVLVGRSGPSAASEEVAAELAAKGATVTTFPADVSNEGDLARVLSEIRATMPPLRGVIHAAGVLDDRLLLNQDAEELPASPGTQGSRRLESPHAHRGLAARFLRSCFRRWPRSSVRRARRIMRPPTRSWTAWRTNAALAACHAFPSTGARGPRSAWPPARQPVPARRRRA